MSKIRMSASDLDSLLSKTRMDARTKEIAHSLFVGGANQTETAAKHGLKRQRVTQIAGQVERLAGEANIGLLVAKEFSFPDELTTSFTDLETALLEQSNQDVYRLAVARVKRAVDSSIGLLRSQDDEI